MTPEQRIAKRSLGAIVMGGFGTLWLAGGIALLFPGRMLLLLLSLATGAVVVVLSTLRYRAHRDALAALRASPAGLRERKLFRWVNVIQWVAILASAAALQLLGHPWLIPSVAVAIIGLHFLPLAVILDARAHWFTGSLMVAVGIASAFATGMFAAGAAELGAGAVLCLSAVYALVANLRHARAAGHAPEPDRRAAA